MNTKLLKGYSRMTFREALRAVPFDEIVSIGCAAGSGWFYFSRSGYINILRVQEMIEKSLHQKLYSYKWDYANYNDALKQLSYIRNCSASGYIRVWKNFIGYPERIKKVEKEIQDFNYYELMEVPCVVFRKVDLTYAIILLKWSISGSYWYLSEWEEKHGKI